ncbi:ABC-2 transporter permease [Olegusella massiliensis]|uniref:ABC-2 transporter permease n=1 Tax=Olegusella massiliensis TaxID=1776381 RepID=UPI0040559416
MLAALYADWCQFLRKFPQYLLLFAAVIIIVGVGAVFGGDDIDIAHVTITNLQIQISLTIFFMVMYILAGGAFSDDEANGWQQARDALPLTRAQVVTGRYVFVFAATITGAIVCILLNGVVVLAMQQFNSNALSTMTEVGSVLVAAALILLLLLSLQMPVLFWWGAQRAWPVMSLPVMLPLLLTFPAPRQGFLRATETLSKLYAQLGMGWSLVVAALLVGLLSFASLKLSQKLYAKRDL